MTTKFTFGEVKFPAPGSSLHSIAQQGIVPLFKFWVEHVRNPTSSPADEWASTSTFFKYVQDYYEKRDLEPIIPEVSDENLQRILTEATGLYFIRKGQESFVVDFIDQDRITVAMMTEQSEISSRDLNRSDWTESFIKENTLLLWAGIPGHEIEILH